MFATNILYVEGSDYSAKATVKRDSYRINDISSSGLPALTHLAESH